MYHTSLWSQHVAQSYEFVQDRYTPRPGITTQIWDNAYATAAIDFEAVKAAGGTGGEAEPVGDRRDHAGLYLPDPDRPVR
jgi:hypothetical protein